MSPEPEPVEEEARPAPDEERLAELVVALSARWRDTAGRLALGAPRGRLAAAAGVGESGLEALLDEVRRRTAPLGLEVIDFYYEKERWYCLKSQYAAPNELASTDQGVLGVVMALIEEQGDPEKAQVPVSELRRRLVGGKYTTRHQLDRSIERLEELGFLVRRKSALSYGPRSLIEFSAERRENIASEARSLIF